MPKNHLFIDLCVVLSVCPLMLHCNSMSLKLPLKMTDGYSGIAGELSKIRISQLHMYSSAVGLHQLPGTVRSRELFLVQMEEVTPQAALTFLSVHNYTLLVRLVANVSSLSGLSEHLLEWLTLVKIN